SPRLSLLNCVVSALHPPSFFIFPVRASPLPFFCPLRPPPRSTLFPYTTLFRSVLGVEPGLRVQGVPAVPVHRPARRGRGIQGDRSEEHTSELQSRENLVCRLLLDKKNRSERHTHPRSGRECRAQTHCLQRCARQ